MDGFQGFGPAVFEWFEALERHNSRDDFAATRERYETRTYRVIHAARAGFYAEPSEEPPEARFGRRRR